MFQFKLPLLNKYKLYFLYLSSLKVAAYFLERKKQQKSIFLNQIHTVYGYLSSPPPTPTVPLFIWPLSFSAMFQMSYCLLYKAGEEFRQISGPVRRLLYHRLFNPKLLGWKYTRLFWMSSFFGRFASSVQ